MEFFGITSHGPQNYIKECLREIYKEPMTKQDCVNLMKIIEQKSLLPKTIQRPDVNTIRFIDCYIGRVNGFALGSIEIFKKMKRKGVIKPVGPSDMYRIPITTSIEYGWWMQDAEVTNASWYKLEKRYPQPASPNTLILDKVRKNNKYASLF
ncbi:uncharacterized protein LOC101745458 [Bombyx mori]|uniref:Uncharacterized protein n=1 Tax=Bombyx mori TaxID=7091 RepID=A0A8R1WF50_BOMMO|nr:uncharacterized protein LOC101745458 [Bombyx mori]